MAEQITTQTPAAAQDVKLNVAPSITKELERLRAENERLKAQAAQQSTSRITLKVSEKGALSVYGMGRWPITLYREQWQRVLGMADEIHAFIKANDKVLKAKE